MGDVKRGRAGVAQDQMLAKGRMMVIDAINDGDFKSQFLVAQTDGERFSVLKCGFVGAYQVELGVGSGAEAAVAHKRELRSHVHEDLARLDEFRMRR